MNSHEQDAKVAEELTLRQFKSLEKEVPMIVSSWLKSRGIPNPDKEADKFLCREAFRPVYKSYAHMLLSVKRHILKLKDSHLQSAIAEIYP